MMNRVVSAVAGFRGAVSLAAALAMPRLVASSGPFPDRDTIIFVTAGVIVVTVAVQAPLLPAVVRWARLPQDTSYAQERQLAETIATEDAVAAIPTLAADLSSDAAVVDQLRREYTKHLRVVQANGHDTVMRHIQSRLDIEEVRLSRRELVD